MTPPKPYKIVPGDPGEAIIVERSTGAELGLVHTIRCAHGTAWAGYLWWPKHEGRLPTGETVNALTRTEAAALVYQAWLDRTSEGSKK